MTMYPQLETGATSVVTAIIQTTKGDLTIELYPDLVPKTVQNFVALAKQGYYDGIIFHRVIPDFMIQTGDPTGTGYGGQSAFGSAFDDEFSNSLFHLKGALSMANSGPNTNGSQFFIVTQESVHPSLLGQMSDAGYPEEIIEAYKKNGGAVGLDGRHAVFGHVVKGLDTAVEISQVPRNASDKPNEEISITGILIQE